MMRHVICAALVAASAVLAEGIARAQDPPIAETVLPPVLVSPVEAAYPAEALAQRVEGTVVLRLTVDADGHVSAAEPVQSAGYGFDEAAREAALRFSFSPAQRNGSPVAARILYSYEFHLPAQAPPEKVETSVPPAAVVPAPSPKGGGSPAPTDVTVKGKSEADRLRSSAEAVTVVEMNRAKRESADLGEVLARTQGVGVRREGGLGSNTRFSLNGLTDDQVRFFLDGVPLELAGYPFGIANVPVNLLNRVEVYSGVVPVRLGADALGGAVNLVTDRDIRGTHAGASYEVGSFDTHRLTLGARHLDEGTGLFARANGFLDYAKNDYPVDVDVADARGVLTPTRVYRFHDRYRAEGGNVEAGFVDRPWAKRLLLRAFVTDFDKEYQHNVVMTVPYGGVSYDQTSMGASLRYTQPLGHGVSLDVVGGYTRTRGHFLDTATCVYDWFGRCTGPRRRPGESDPLRPHDDVVFDDSGFARFNLEWRFHHAHALRLSVAPTYLARTGRSQFPSDSQDRDPLSADRKLFTLVNGLEYEANLFDGRLQNIAFAKDYVQSLDGEEPLPGNIFQRRDRSTHRFGAGNGIRYRFSPWLYAKASYEYATRLPRADEVFGDNAFIIPNLNLEPESSHNGNLGLTFDARETPSGGWRATANAFVREARNLIVVLGDARAQSYQNVYDGRSLGVEGSAGWTSPGEYVVLDGNVTYVDFRNRSREGTFGDFEGDRIPNRPYFFGNASMRLQMRNALAPQDEISLTWNSRYVHSFFRTWESIGQTDFKKEIPSQFVHSVALGYVVRKNATSFGMAVEAQNLTDEAVFDFFGVQRPGRAFYVKTSADF
ncbi:TonB-dependent siderophore myxochelin receptor MxcH [Pendulispora brunnea]|uniref:TonB-dependent siderophore myxochelin receptor MxcH n=1 Tax=Pendulispora brunnea TaxID=2905690 RepID=A0ABZ2K1C3_9BACT